MWHSIEVLSTWLTDWLSHQLLDCLTKKLGKMWGKKEIFKCWEPLCPPPPSPFYSPFWHERSAFQSVGVRAVDHPQRYMVAIISNIFSFWCQQAKILIYQSIFKIFFSRWHWMGWVLTTYSTLDPESPICIGKGLFFFLGWDLRVSDIFEKQAYSLKHLRLITNLNWTDFNNKIRNLIP